MTDALINQLNAAIKNDDITEADVKEIRRQVIARAVGKHAKAGTSKSAYGCGNCGYHC